MSIFKRKKNLEHIGDNNNEKTSKDSKVKTPHFFRQLYEKLCIVLLQKIEDLGRPIAPDTQTREAIEHSRYYTKLLKSYIKSTKWNARLKLVFKIFFFVITMGALVAIIYIFYLSLDYSFGVFTKVESLSEITMESIFSSITVIIPALASLITAFLKIPEIIAQYLFNLDEDKDMTAVIKDIQAYDSSIVDKDSLVEKKIEEQRTSQSNDSPFEGSPKESTDASIIGSSSEDISA